MAVPNNPLVVRVTIFGQRDTRQVLNTFHVRNSAGWTLASMATLATDVKNWIDAQYKTAVPAPYFWYQISVRLYDPSTPLAVDTSITPVIVATRTGVAEAGNVTSTMSLRTGLAGRKFRGRMYVAGLATSDVQGNDTLTSAYVTLLSIVTQAFLTAISSGTRNLVIFHKPTNTTTDVIGFAIENIVDSQRRRLPGRGR